MGGVRNRPVARRRTRAFDRRFGQGKAPGAEFGRRDCPTAPGFDAAVVLFYRLVVVVGDISNSVFFLQREYRLDSFM